MRTEVNINTEIFTWAIARAGFDLYEFAVKVPNIADWINGEKKPTVKQLEDFSRKVHLPFGYMFLSEPPKEKLPIPFFRTNNPSEQVSLNVYDTILLLQQRQDWLSGYLAEVEFDELSFVGKYKNSRNVYEIVADIRVCLGLSEHWASQFKVWQEALDFLTKQIEDVGIITVFNGIVENNTHRPINVEECRGFVLVNNIAPFMFVNNADSKAAQMFTIVHELAHIWTGNSAGFDFRKMEPANDPGEILCDKVAAEFLVPEKAFEAVWNDTSNIKNAARYFKVSEIVIARRALDLKKITKESFFEFYNDYINREFIKKDNQPSGGDFYATTRKRLGISYSVHVNNAVKSGKLLYRDAYRLTGLKGDTFQTYFSSHI
jgi:Zn-dependent peptidase ImmA (M78 family)